MPVRRAGQAANVRVAVLFLITVTGSNCWAIISLLRQFYFY